MSGQRTNRGALVFMLLSVVSAVCVSESLFSQSSEPHAQSGPAANDQSAHNIEMPRAKNTFDPPYSKEAREKHLEGSVELRVVIGTDGKVEDLSATSGDPVLAAAAVDAVRQWTFEPKRVDGQAVEAEVKICVDFHLLTAGSADSNGMGCRTTKGVTSARVISQVPPIYPAKARKKHIEGQVLLQARIGVDGIVQDLSVISGNPELTQAAIDAVRQWRYSPTLKDGTPVEVTTKITVKFTLGGRH
jgi:TonB family protein